MFKQTRKNTDNASTLLSPIFSINGNNYKSLDRCPKIIMAVIVYLPVKLMKAFFSLWLWAHILEVDRLISTSVQFSHSVASNSLRFHGLQHARLPCPSPTPRACSNSCPLSLWCHTTISSSVIPFSSCLQSFPASGAFQVCQLFTSGGQSIGASG